MVLQLRQLESRTDRASAGDWATVPGFPTTTPARAQQFVMSNTKTFRSHGGQ